MKLDRSDLPPAEPGYFHSETGACLRWLHRPAATSGLRDVGVVICNPVGQEALCGHRSLRHIATECAIRGVPALRFDYEGTGDSAGDDLDPGRWAAWIASVRAAGRELRETMDVSRVVLLGVRLGATLATAAALGDPDVAGIVLVAPITNGRSWLRELRALRGTMGRSSGPAELALPEDVLESAGVLITPETRASLESVDLAALGSHMPENVLLIDRTDRPAHDALLEQWRTAGRNVRHAVLPGYVEMMSDPHESQVPAAFIAEITGWLDEAFPSLRSPLEPRPTSSVAVRGGGRSTFSALIADRIEERVHLLDEDQRLFGVMTLPQGTPPDRAVVLMTSGANHHIGQSRLHVKLARRLAAAGWMVLRYDVSGIGDSPPRDGAPENEVYTAHAVPDLAVALNFLQREYAPKRTEVMGLCSGGYHAFKGAVDGLPLSGVTVINPLVFFWKPGSSLAYPAFERVNTVSGYKRSALRPEKWLKVIRGGGDVREFAMVMVNQVTDRVRRSARELRRAIHAPVEDDLAAEISQIVRRGVALRFVFSSHEPGETLLRAGAGRALSKLEAGGAVSISHLPDCDHSLSCAWMHDMLWAWIARAIDLDD